MTDFVAIDFETADHGADSACAVALVRVRAGKVAERATRLLRPPRPHIHFSYIHGITWDMVAGEPSFAQVWPELEPLLEGASYLVAHNAGFDRKVLKTCCAEAGLRSPALPFACTVRLARRAWDLRPTKLPDVCRFLGLRLRHHDPASDALACAKIALAAMADGFGLEPA